MFDIGTEQEKEEMEKQKYHLKNIQNCRKRVIFMEKEMLGIYISGHPLEKLREQIMHSTNISSIDLIQINEQNLANNTENNAEGSIEMSNAQIKNTKPKFVDGQKVKFAGIITSIKRNTQKIIK